MKAATVLLLVAGLASSPRPTVLACRYCEQSADPVEVMRFQSQGRKAVGGSFSPEDSLNTYVTGAPAPTPAGTVLPPEPSPVVVPTPVAPVALAPPAIVPMPTATPIPVSAAEPPPTVAVATPNPVRPSPVPPSARWADLGLLGLAALGGWFAWRTRAVRPSATA